MSPTTANALPAGVDAAVQHLRQGPQESSQKSPQHRSQRRRGATLEKALLDAALDELGEKGYSGFTIESVAARAETSRAVLYRRWPTKADLVRAALTHARREQPVVVPDTGSLREDLLELMGRTARARSRVVTLVLMQLSAYFAETGTDLADLRSSFLADGSANAFDVVYERTIARGELDRTRLSPRVASLPMDLLRHELMMTLEPPPNEALASIVDEIVLPLMRGPERS